MRKRINGFDQLTERSNEEWLDIANLGKIEVTSEGDSFHIDSAILPGAKEVGVRPVREQTIGIAAEAHAHFCSL